MNSQRNIVHAANTISMPITSGLANNTSIATHYLYGCSYYEDFGFHCDPILNEFRSYAVLANYTKVASATREPVYVQSTFGKGLQTIGGDKNLESLRANNIKPYSANQFSVYLSFRPDKYDVNTDSVYMSLISYKNGSYMQDPHKGGWELGLVPNNNTSMKKLRFTVFNTNGSYISPKDIDIPAEKFSEIIGTFNGTKVRIFVNGTLKSEIPFHGNYSGQVDRNNYLTIAGDAYCTCYLGSGIFDEVRYYNFSLDKVQVNRINSSHDIAGKGLVGYWKLDGTLRDYSDFKNDLFYNTLIASMAFTPDGRLFYSEKNSGNIRIMINNTILDRPFTSIPNIHVGSEQGLLGLAIDSKFRDNHFIYAYYNYKDELTGNVYAKIVRFTDVNNRGTDEAIILDKIAASSEGYHTGGALMFNKVDDKLYATVGDATGDEIAQNLSSLNGKTLRLNRDGTIPGDNPFLNSPIYTYGHRNMFGIAFDERGHGIVTEAGRIVYDEINSQIKGGNYGWPTTQPADIAPDYLANGVSIKPMRSYYFSQNPTQAIYYHGDKYPELKGKFVVGSFRGNLLAYKISEDGNNLLEEINLRTSHYPSLEVVATAESPNGDIYFGAYDIFRLEKIDPTSKVDIMFPIEINATNVKISNMDYLEPTKELTLHLTERHGSSTMFIKIPKSIIEDIPEYYPHKSVNKLTNSSLTESESLYQLQVQRHDNYSVVEVQLQADAPKTLQFTINKFKSFITPVHTKSAGTDSKLSVIGYNDTTIPVVKIVDPPYPLTVVSNKTIIINGSASDSGSGIKKIEAFVHTFPFKEHWPYKLATDESRGNWSKWSFPVDINSSGSYRISIQATDNAGNENWAETIINVPFVDTAPMKGSQNKIAFVDNTFTRSAYSDHGFYDFYFKYGFPPFGKKITTDLDMLTTDIQPFVINETNSAHMSNLTALIPQETDESRFWRPFVEHTERTFPNATITVLRDQDVHGGHIFKLDGSNAYDTIILFHDEYVTEKEYNNYKNFVRNGGTIVFLDGNVFYAEVQYNEDKQTITLVKGHDWQFDGISARRGVEERWYNETKQWVGANFIVTDIGTKIGFENNPFNYTHFEENFVNNPNVHIIRDYKIKFPADYLATGNKFPPGKEQGDITIATYDLSYGKGKVIMLGLYGQRLANNENFVKFFGDLVNHQYTLK